MNIYVALSLDSWASGGIRPGGLGLTDRAMVLCDLQPKATILDVGCGTGLTVEHLRNKHGVLATGLDLSRNLLENGRNRYWDFPAIRADVRDIPCPDGHFDAVIAECSLSAARDVDRALEEIYRVMKEGGRLILSDLYAREPRAMPALRTLSAECCLRGASGREELCRRIVSHGFSIDQWEDHSDLLKELAARIVLSQPSREPFWLQTTLANFDPERMKSAVAAARPGYCLLIATKRHAGGALFQPRGD